MFVRITHHRPNDKQTDVWCSFNGSHADYEVTIYLIRNIIGDRLSKYDFSADSECLVNAFRKSASEPLVIKVEYYTTYTPTFLRALR